MSFNQILKTLKSTYVLVHLGCCNTITDCVAYKWQTFIPHSSGGGEVQDQGTRRFGVCYGPLPG